MPLAADATIGHCALLRDDGTPEVMDGRNRSASDFPAREQPITL